jgi:hypothetical protein
MQVDHDPEELRPLRSHTLLPQHPCLGINVGAAQQATPLADGPAALERMIRRGRTDARKRVLIRPFFCWPMRRKAGRCRLMRASPAAAVRVSACMIERVWQEQAREPRQTTRTVAQGVSRGSMRRVSGAVRLASGAWPVGSTGGRAQPDPRADTIGGAGQGPSPGWPRRADGGDVPDCQKMMVLPQFA